MKRWGTLFYFFEYFCGCHQADFFCDKNQLEGPKYDLKQRIAKTQT